jgi:hypothetical protein
MSEQRPLDEEFARVELELRAAPSPEGCPRVLCGSGGRGT